jgi:MerR family redox-sensitive transcriptional activator SoxR
MTLLSIGQVAERTGLRTSAIRFYESAGVISEPLRVNGPRRFDPEVLAQLAVVRMAQDAGCSIEEIRELVSGFPAGTPAADRWRVVATRKLPEVEAKIARLQVMHQLLHESLKCGCLTLDGCAAIGWTAVHRDHRDTH